MKKKLNTYATNISWETDGESVDLPTEVLIPPKVYKEAETESNNDVDLICDFISDWLSDTYGWLHNGFNIVTK